MVEPVEEVILETEKAKPAAVEATGEAEKVKNKVEEKNEETKKANGQEEKAEVADSEATKQTGLKPLKSVDSIVEKLKSDTNLTDR